MNHNIKQHPAMQRLAFKMKLFKGFEEEYKNRHENIDGELKKLLKKAGIDNYSIFLDEETNDLFAYLVIDDVRKLDALANEPVMKKWWNYMKDIMETNSDNSPVTKPLQEVFYMR
jgi:L-rhamnose mutarotase